MNLSSTSFRGEVPRITPRALPDNAAQDATNAKLLSGDLEAWKRFALEKSLARAAPVRSIYLLADQYWLSFNEEVTFAKGIIPADTTHRTFITGLSQGPVWTNVALATGGAEPYPVTVRPLGVPSPDAPPSAVATTSTTTIDVTDAGDNLGNWTASGTVTVASSTSSVTQDAAVGDPAPSYKITFKNNVGNPAYLYRDFSIGSSITSEMSFDFMCSNTNMSEAGFYFMCSSTGVGPGGKIWHRSTESQHYLSLGVAAGWGTIPSFLTQIPIPSFAINVWYHVVVTATINTSGVASMTAKLFNGSTLVAESSLENVTVTGGFCGFHNVTVFTGADSATHYDNIHVLASGNNSAGANATATTYVYTFVNDIGEESAPSPASNIVTRADGVEVDVTTPTVIPTGVSSSYGIATKRIYRAVTGTAGTAFQFVAEIPLSQAVYSDLLTDSALGEVLPSDGWDLPPSDLRGILALPNGVMAGFSKNQLCFSAQNHPHAWPVSYRLTTDKDITGIGAIGTYVVIGTKSFPYLATGNDPASYSMGKLDALQACTSMRSMVNTLQFGVIYSSPDGLMSVSASGQIQNLTETVFTRDQWQALDPSSIQAAVYEDQLFFFYDGDGPESGNTTKGYALDAKSNGYGLIPLGFHAIASYVDPLTDSLFLVLDTYDEPTHPLLPDPGVNLNPDSKTIYQFNASGQLMNYRYRSKLFLLSYPTVFSAAQVRAQSYGNVVALMYGLDVNDTQILFDERQITGQREFVPKFPPDELREFEIEFIGSSPLRLWQVAEGMEELG